MILIFIVGPIQFTGPGSDAISHTLLLELGVQA
jgi:pyrophosphate--fructose-6-phosphate 1-phosphotransferase